MSPVKALISRLFHVKRSKTARTPPAHTYRVESKPRPSINDALHRKLADEVRQERSVT